MTNSFKLFLHIHCPSLNLQTRFRRTVHKPLTLLDRTSSMHKQANSIWNKQQVLHQLLPWLAVTCSYSVTSCPFYSVATQGGQEFRGKFCFTSKHEPPEKVKNWCSPFVLLHFQKSGSTSGKHNGLLWGKDTHIFKHKTHLFALFITSNKKNNYFQC